MRYLLKTIEEAESTNSLVMQAIDCDQPEGYAVLAERQTAGYGRSGHVWFSPKGGVYLSLLLRPKDAPWSVATLGHIASLAACRVAFRLGAENVRIKWPNDVVVADDFDEGRSEGTRSGDVCRNTERYRKLAGILVQGRSGAFCVGWGMNVALDRDDVPRTIREEVGYGITCLEDQIGKVDGLSSVEVARQILDEFQSMYEIWCASGFSPFVAEYERCSFLAGRFVSVGSKTGEVVGIDETGALLVRVGAGETIPVSIGEAHVLSAR